MREERWAEEEERLIERREETTTGACDRRERGRAREGETAVRDRFPAWWCASRGW